MDWDIELFVRDRKGEGYFLNGCLPKGSPIPRQGERIWLHGYGTPPYHVVDQVDYYPPDRIVSINVTKI